MGLCICTKGLIQVRPTTFIWQCRRDLFSVGCVCVGGGGGNIPLGHLEAGVSEQGAGGGGGPEYDLPPKFRGPRPTRLSIFHS